MVKHVVLEGSDHAMLILFTKVVQPRRKCQFMYDPRWNQDEQCGEVVRQEWGRVHEGAPAHILVSKLRKVKHGLLQ